MASASLVPPGYSPPFATVSSDDHTAWILIATTLGMIYSLIFCGFRGFVAYTTRRSFGLDDIAIAMGTILAAIQSIINLVACSKGLGKSSKYIDPSQLETIQHEFYSAKLIFIIALGLSKISVFLLLKQLVPQARHRKLFWGFIGFIGLWTIASLFALALQCDLARPWIVIGTHCSSIYLRWKIISAFDIFIELTAVGSIIFIVWNLQTSWSNKATVGAAFALRLTMIIPIAFRLRSFRENGVHTDPTLAQVQFIVWTQVELHYSLISATIPCLRPVINRLATHYGALGPAESSAYGSASGRGSGRRNRLDDYQLSSLKRSVRSAERPVDEDNAAVTGKEKAYSYDIETAGVAGKGDPAARRVSRVGSAESRELIIQKHVSWTVESESIGPRQR